MKRLLVGLALVACSVVAWLIASGVDAPDEVASPAPSSRPEGPREHVELDQVAGGAPAPTQREAARSVETTHPPAAAGPLSERTFVGELRNAARGEPPRERVVVTFSAAEDRREGVFDASTARFTIPELPDGPWNVEIRAAGFHTLTTSLRIDSDSRREEPFELWPADWILVRAVTVDGEPYGVLATRVGLDVADVFEAGFRVWLASEPPADPRAWPAEPPLTSGAQVSMASPHYERRCDPREVARVRRVEGATTWVALAFHSRFCGWAELPANVGGVEFEIAAEDVASQFGSLTFCAVDAHSEAPLLDARATLDAEVSGLRRPDTSSLAIDDRGCFHARPLLPGEYDLSVTAPGRSEHLQRVTIAPAQRIDLGEIALEFAAPLEVRVVDEQGRPVRALLQFGPWRPGEWIFDCVTPRGATTDSEGAERVPRPAVKTVVRAEPFVRTTGEALGDGRPSPMTDASRAAHAVFDPESGALSIELVIRDPVHVTLSLPRTEVEAADVQVLDRNEIVVARARAKDRRSAFLVPSGDYRARLVDAGGEEIGSHAFAVPRTVERVLIELR